MRACDRGIYHVLAENVFRMAGLLSLKLLENSGWSGAITVSFSISRPRACFVHGAARLAKIKIPLLNRTGPSHPTQPNLILPHPAQPYPTLTYLTLPYPSLP